MSQYPDDEDLNAIHAFEPPGNWSGSKPWLPILELAEAAWNQTYGRTEWDPNHGQITFITGGWSGNEEVLGALYENPSAKHMLWLASFRGGKEIWGVKP